MKVEREDKMIDEALEIAISKTDDVDQQWWYQEGYRDGAKAYEKEMLDKACELVGSYFEGGTNMERDYWVNRFRKAMEE